jgi:hypothetical protein
LNFNVRNEIARGYLLLGVFFMHGLWFYTAPMPDWHSAPIPFSILKLLGPDVSIYYLLTGMSLTGIGRKSFRAVLPQSLMLIFMAWVSEGLGIIAVQLLYGNYHAGLPFFKAAIKPMVYGTGGITVITWFFTTVAVARLLVWIFEKNKIYFTLAWLIILGLIVASNELNWPDSLYEWPDWPMATLLMIIGLKFPKDWAVPRAIGLASLPLSLLLIWPHLPDRLRCRARSRGHRIFAGLYCRAISVLSVPALGGAGLAADGAQYRPVFRAAIAAISVDARLGAGDHLADDVTPVSAAGQFHRALGDAGLHSSDPRRHLQSHRNPLEPGAGLMLQSRPHGHGLDLPSARPGNGGPPPVQPWPAV